MRTHWLLTLSLGWLLAFDLGSGVLAQDSPKLSAPKVPLEQLLNSDGTLNLQTGFNGSLDPQGWTTASGPGQQESVQLDYSGDTDGDGISDQITVVSSGIQVVHGGTGTTSFYSYSDVSFSLVTIQDTDGVRGHEIIVIWARNNPPYYSNGIHVIHDRTGDTKNYQQDRQFRIWNSGAPYYSFSDTDGQPGYEIIVIWVTNFPNYDNGIDVIHDRTETTKIYQQDGVFQVSFVSDTDGEAGNEIIVTWAANFPTYDNGIRVIHDKTGDTNDYRQNRGFSISSLSDTDGEPGNEIIVIWVLEFPYNGIEVIHDRTKTTNNYPQNTTFSINDVSDYDGVRGAEICISWFSGDSLYAVIVDRTRKTIRTSGCDIIQLGGSFRTHQSGDWSDSNTWEENIPSIGWTYPASQIPNIGHRDIRIRTGHAVDIRSFDVTAYYLTVDGTLQVDDTLQVGGILNVNGTLINNGTTQIYGTVYINQGGAASGNDFIYTGLSSRLVFNGSNSSIDNGTVLWPSTNGPAHITVQNGASVMLNAARTVSGSLVVANGILQVAGTLQVSGILQVNGTLTNNGTTQISGTVQINQRGAASGNDFVYTGCCSRLEFQNGSYSIDSGTVFWPSTNGPANVTVQDNASVTLNVARTVSGSLEVYVYGTLQVADTLTTYGTTQIYGTFQINQGGTVSGNNLVYAEASGKLVLNGACSIDSGNTFWPSTDGPANVTVQRAGSVTLNVARTVSDSLEVYGTLQIADTLTTNGARVEGTLHVAGTLTTNGATVVLDGTLLVAGTLTNYGTMANYGGTYQVTGTLTNNGITRYGTYQVSGTLINNGIQSLQTCRVSGTLTNNGTTQITSTFQLDQGGAASGTDFIYNEYGTLVFNHSSGSYGVNSGDVIWPSTSGPGRVTVQGPGGITMNVARAVQQFETAAAVTNADSLTISGTVTINAGGFVDSSPTYNGEITLVYGANGSYDVGMEWGSGTVIGSGVPMNVIINNGATVNMPSSARTCLGNLSIRGTLALSTTPGADLSVGGDWKNSGTLIPNSRTVIFNGATEQTLRGVTRFDFLTINNSAGISVPGYYEGEGGYEEIDSVTVRQTLTFTAGNIRLGQEWRSFLMLSGSVTGDSTGRHVVTYLSGRIVRSIAGGGSSQFPVGPTETSYNPLTIALDPADSTETFSVRVDSTVNPTAPDNSLCVRRTWDIREATQGDNHAALTFQWAGAEEGAKFTHNASSTYYYNGEYVEVVSNGGVSGTDPYIVSTTGGFPCTEFPPYARSSYVVGTSGGLTAVEESKNRIPTSFMLSQNHPNPFNPSTTIRYAIPKAGHVTLRVYDLVGHEIETLVSEKQSAGEYAIRWNPVGLPSGVYVYRLQVGDASSGSAQRFVATRKLLLVK